MFNYAIKKFPTGLRLLMVPSKESLSFQIMVLVNTGSDFETKRINGISHFLEHMCFKGTKKRPSNLIITKELDQVGGSYNAFTSREKTGYYARVAKDFKELAIDIVADIYINSQFPEKEIEKEKGVILEEISMYKDLPPKLIWDLWEQLLYGNQPAGWSILGPEKNIKRFKRKNFLNYFNQQYKSRSTIVVTSGNFSQQEIVKLVEKYFGNIRKGKGNKKPITKQKQKKPEILLEYRKTDQTHLILGVRSYNLFNKKIYPLIVLDAILDGGMSSYLWQLIREKLGAAYYAFSDVERFTDRGYWAVAAGIDNDRLELVLKEILKEWKKLKKEYLIKDNLKKAKDYIKGKIALQTENVHNVASIFASQLLLENRIETLKEYLAKINKVTLKDLSVVANELLKTQNLNLALIGPFKNKERLLKLLKI
ncbi:MAG: M16 family metallopeptidase [Minisyncoccia bacterium]